MSVWGAVCPRPQAVILRESGVSSTPRPFDQIMDTLEYWITRIRG
jgi:hypothetical protein